MFLIQYATFRTVVGSGRSGRPLAVDTVVVVFVVVVVVAVVLAVVVAGGRVRRVTGVSRLIGGHRWSGRPDAVLMTAGRRNGRVGHRWRHRALEQRDGQQRGRRNGRATARTAHRLYGGHTHFLQAREPRAAADTANDSCAPRTRGALLRPGHLLLYVQYNIMHVFAGHPACALYTSMYVLCNTYTYTDCACGHTCAVKRSKNA